MSEDELLSALSSYESIKYENYDSDTGEILRKKTAMADPTTINKTITEIRNENHDENKIVRNLKFLLDLEKDHYEPIKAVNAFDNSYIQYESIGDKDKAPSIKEYIDIIRP